MNSFDQVIARTVSALYIFAKTDTLWAAGLTKLEQTFHLFHYMKEKVILKKETRRKGLQLNSTFVYMFNSLLILWTAIGQNCLCPYLSGKSWLLILPLWPQLEGDVSFHHGTWANFHLPRWLKCRTTRLLCHIDAFAHDYILGSLKYMNTKCCIDKVDSVVCK